MPDEHAWGFGLVATATLLTGEHACGIIPTLGDPQDIDRVVIWRLEMARIEDGAGYAAWAKRLGISERHYWNYRRGQRRIPRYVVERASLETGKPVEWFYEPEQGVNPERSRVAIEDALGVINDQLTVIQEALGVQASPRGQRRRRRAADQSTSQEPS